MSLTARQQAFVDAFDGNGTAAARAAGYKGSDNTLAVQARRLLRNAQIRAAIDARLGPDAKKRIADREERQAFWTSVMRDANKKMDARLKASELLGKSEADFKEKVEHSGGMSLSVSDPYAEPKK